MIMLGYEKKWKIGVGIRTTSHTFKIIIADWSHKLRQCYFLSSNVWVISFFKCMGDLNKHHPLKACVFDCLISR